MLLDLPLFAVFLVHISILIQNTLMLTWREHAFQSFKAVQKAHFFPQTDAAKHTLFLL